MEDKEEEEKLGEITIYSWVCRTLNHCQPLKAARHCQSLIVVDDGEWLL
jgi:hypothetical protein